MSNRSKKNVVCLLVMLAATAFAVPAAPTVKTAGFINGVLNVCVKKTPIADCTLELQMKDRGTDDAATTRCAAASPTR